MLSTPIELEGPETAIISVNGHSSKSSVFWTGPPTQYIQTTKKSENAVILINMVFEDIKISSIDHQVYFFFRPVMTEKPRTTSIAANPGDFGTSVVAFSGDTLLGPSRPTSVISMVCCC